MLPNIFWAKLELCRKFVRFERSITATVIAHHPHHLIPFIDLGFLVSVKKSTPTNFILTMG
jgi:hypothetical protein